MGAPPKFTEIIVKLKEYALTQWLNKENKEKGTKEEMESLNLLDLEDTKLYMVTIGKDYGLFLLS